MPDTMVPQELLLVRALPDRHLAEQPRLSSFEPSSGLPSAIFHLHENVMIANFLHFRLCRRLVPRAYTLALGTCPGIMVSSPRCGMRGDLAASTT